jgi:hypothetical protein
MESHLGKYDKLVLGLALLFSLIDERNDCVTADALKKAIALGEYFRSHAERIYSLATSKYTPLAKLLLKKLPIFKEGYFSVNQVYKKCWSGLTDKDSIEIAINELLEHGYIKVRKVEVKNGRPPSPSYLIHPSVFTD